MGICEREMALQLENSLNWWTVIWQQCEMKRNGEEKISGEEEVSGDGESSDFFLWLKSVSVICENMLREYV